MRNITLLQVMRLTSLTRTEKKEHMWSLCVYFYSVIYIPITVLHVFATHDRENTNNVLCLTNSNG